MGADDLGPREQRVTRLGFLPSPFEQHLVGSMSMPLEGGGTVDLPYEASLAESAYRFVEGEAGERTYAGANCLTCHASQYGDMIVAGAPNKDVHLYNLQKKLLQNPKINAMGLVIDDPDKVRNVMAITLDKWLEDRDLPPATLDISDAEVDILRSTHSYMKHVGSQVYTDATMQTVGSTVLDVHRLQLDGLPRAWRARHGLVVRTWHGGGHQPAVPADARHR